MQLRTTNRTCNNWGTLAYSWDTSDTVCQHPTTLHLIVRSCHDMRTMHQAQSIEHGVNTQCPQVNHKWSNQVYTNAYRNTVETTVKEIQKL